MTDIAPLKIALDRANRGMYDAHARRDIPTAYAYAEELVALSESIRAILRKAKDVTIVDNKPVDM